MSVAGRACAGALAGVMALASPAFADAPVGDPMLSPAEAIAQLDAAPAGSVVTGTFTFVVAGAGHDKAGTYLNSLPDYKDPGCLTVEIHAEAMRGLRVRYGKDVEGALRGKRIAVRGDARKVRIRMGERPRMVLGQLYRAVYQQTHVMVDEADQLQVLNGAPAADAGEARG